MSQALSTLRAGATALLPIYPSSFEDVARLARMTIMSGMIKPQKTGWGDDAVTEDVSATEARATMIILQGMELGIPPMQAVQLLAMINGRITAHSEAVPGLLLSKGFKIDKAWTGLEMADDWGVTCFLTRPTGERFEGSFSVAKAKRAGLWSPEPKIKKKGKNGWYDADNDSAWHKYPDRMLWARALGFAAKDGAADALKGLIVREEIEDMIRSEYARDITPAKPTPAALEIPDDIPDIPGSSDGEKAKPDLVKSEISEPDNEPDEPFADPDSVIAKISDDLALCESVEEVTEVEAQYADWLPRLPKAHQNKAKKLFVDAKE